MTDVLGVSLSRWRTHPKNYKMKTTRLWKINVCRRSFLHFIFFIASTISKSIGACFFSYFIASCELRSIPKLHLRSSVKFSCSVNWFIFEWSYHLSIRLYLISKIIRVPTGIPSFQCQGSQPEIRDPRDPGTPLVSSPGHLLDACAM